MSTAISDDDTWTSAPTGPATGDPRTSVLLRGHLGELGNRTRWLYNRLIKRLVASSYVTFAAGDVDTATNRITITAHAIPDGTPAQYGNVSGTALSVSGVALSLAEGVYAAPVYVKVIDANTVELEATAGGGAIDITAAGSGTHYLFTLPSTLAFLMHRAFTMAGTSESIPAGNLLVTLANKFLSRAGGTITGPITFSGSTAYTVERCAALNNAATQTITGVAAHHFLCPDISQDSVYTINDGTAEGQWFVVSRRVSANAFLADFKDSGANQICRFPASAKSWCLFRWSNQDGAGLKWHADQYGGSAIPGT